MSHHNQSDRAAVAQQNPLTPAELTHLVAQAHRLRRANIDYLQLREKDLSPADLHTLAAALRRLIPPGQRPRLLLNLGHPADHAANLALALTLRLDGLHLPASTPAHLPAEIRAAFARACRSTPILSLSAHTLPEVTRARAANLDLILFGPVFGKTVFPQTPNTQHPNTQNPNSQLPTAQTPVTHPSASHPPTTHLPAAQPPIAHPRASRTSAPQPLEGQLVTPPTGLDLLAQAVRLAHPTPVLALGGLTAANTPAALATGAAGIAGIRLFL